MSGHDADDAKQRKESRKAVRDRWAQPEYVIFPAIEPVSGMSKIAVPEKIVARSETLARAFLVESATFPGDLVKKECFVSPAHWALYWCIASASSFVCGNLGDADGEDGRTGTFLRYLASRMEHVGFELEDDAQIDIAVSPIWSVNNPVVKEAALGADLLLVLDIGNGEPVKGAAEEHAGGQTQPSRSPCVQLFWMQAKLVEMEKCNVVEIYTLDYGREKKASAKNTAAKTAAKAAHNDVAEKQVAAQVAKEPEFQFERLNKVHDPASGSYAFYAQYANQIPFVPVVSVRDLDAPTKKEHKASLIAKGARFAEWLVERTICQAAGSAAGGVPDAEYASTGGKPMTSGIAGEDLPKTREAWGSFSSFKDIQEFLVSKSADVPYLMVTLCVREANEHMLVISQQLQEYFDERIKQLNQSRAAGTPSGANSMKADSGTDAADGTVVRNPDPKASIGGIGERREAAFRMRRKKSGAPHAADGQPPTPPGGDDGGARALGSKPGGRRRRR
ncbi:hypothetical protein [Burkholderia gladioli]|uniref:hypothetical protein n=1 Tax=Burkholderia gladioli TaxID=28095 RepID=UPI0038B23DF9